MKNNLFKKSMSVFLSVLMILSCWVFVPGEHNHAEAASLEAASSLYNKSLLNGINTNVDYAVNTEGNYYRFKIYGNGDVSNADTLDRRKTYYKNLLSSSVSLVENKTMGAWVTGVTNSENETSVIYPTMVLKYDGQTTPRFGIMFQSDSVKNKNVKFKRVWMSSGSNGLSFNPNYWVGIAAEDSAFFYIMAESNKKYLYAQDTSTGDQFAARKTGQWEFLASTLEFTDSMSIGEWVRAITPTWKFNDQSKDYTLTTTSTIYVMNFKGYGELLTRINNHKADLLANAGQYTTDSIKTYVDAAKAITNLNPKNYTGTGSAASWGSQMNTAYTNYNNAVNGLKKREYEVTYDNMFSLADWRYSQSSEKSGNVTVDLNAGKVTVVYPNGAGGNEYVTNHSGSSSNANTRNTNYYAMPVVGGQEYTMKYTTDGAYTEMFAFFYDKNGGCTHEGSYGAYNFSVAKGTGERTVKAPDGSAYMEIRLDNNTNNTTANFWDIMIYPAAVKTENEVDNWTARPHRALYNYNASVGTLQTPARPGYIFDGWMEDTDGDGIGDAAAPTGTITSSRVLYSTWTPGTMDVGYDNLFSVSEWGKAALGAKTNQGGTITVDADNGTIAIENPANAGSNDNNYTPWTYAVPVDAGKEYIFVYDTDIVGATGTQIHLFYKTSAEATGWTGFPDSPYVKTEGHKEKNTIVFTVPEGTTHLSFRFGTTDGAGMTNTFSNIGLFEKADYDAYAKDYAKVREPFIIGDTKNLMNPTREGYEFDGWTLADGTKVTSTDGFNANTVVYANWTKLWTVTYYYGDNTTVLATVEVKDGETVGTLPSVTPTKDTDSVNSYNFKHWEANGTKFTADTAITADLSVLPIFDETAHSDFVFTLKKASTCTVNATVIKKCGNCGYSFGDVTYNPAEDANAASHTGWLAKGHDYSDGEILANSSTGNTDADTHSIKCARYDTCGSVEKVAHSWNYMGESGADCTNAATINWECPCGAEKTTTGDIAADVHNYDETKGTPNGDGKNHTVVCANNSAHTKTVACTDTDNNCECDICGQELIHVYDQKTETYQKSAADCVNDAVYYYTCKCGKQGTETWTKTGSKVEHTYTNYVYNNDAKCGVDGTKTAECDTCDTGATDTITAEGTAREHEFTGAIKDNENGTHSYKCKYDDCDVYGGTKNCTYGEWDTSDSYKHVATCTACGHKLEGDHDWTAWATTDEYKQADGTHKRGCTVCYKQVEKNCTYTRYSYAETCTTDGYTRHSCNDCGHNYTTADKGKTGHNYTGTVESYDNGYHNFLCKNGCNTYGYAGVENARALCEYKYDNTADGSHKATCTACAYSFTEACSGGQATCTEKAECTKCNTVYGETVPHSFTGTVIALEGDKHAFLCEYCETPGLYGVFEHEGETEVCFGGEATCTALAICNECEEGYGSFAPHTFDGDAVALEGDVHAYRCSVCKDDTLYGVGTTINDTEACSGGKATCSALAVCDKCEDTHGKLDPFEHKYSDECVNVEGENEHKYICEYNSEHYYLESCTNLTYTYVKPDCEAEGYTINTCGLCGNSWKDDIKSPAGHKWSACVSNENGTHTRTCEREGCHYGTDGAAKVETANCKDYVSMHNTAAPTCTAKGYTKYWCGECQYEWVDDYVDPTGHHYKEKKKKDTAEYLRSSKDCVTDLTYWYCCDDCNVSAGTEKDKYENEADLYWVSEPAAGHVSAMIPAEEYLYSEATCTVAAVYYYACKNCGEVDKSGQYQYGSKLGHDWTETETYLKSAADCVNNEVYYKECSRCHYSSQNLGDETWTKPNTLSGHDFEDGYTEGVAATCTEPGVVEHYTCNVCKKHFKADQTTEIAADKLTIAALKHDFEDVAAKAATCEEAGYTKHKQCQREGCGHRNTDYKVIPALGHEFKAENGYYTDTVYNYHAYKCSNCDVYGVDGVKYTVDTSDIDPVITGGIKCEFTGEYVNYEDNGVHSHKLNCVCGNVTSEACYDAEPEHVLPTCTQDGYYVHTCDVCSFEWTVESDAEEDKATDHDFEGVAWTQVAGKQEHTRKCKNCDVRETADCSTENPATTCGQKNICDDCKQPFGEQIDHTWVEVAEEKYLKSAATCTAAAVYYKSCKDCGTKSEETFENGEALGHKMVDFTYDASKWDAPEGFDKTTIVEPTCHSEGLAVSWCTVCDYYLTKISPADTSAHVWGEWDAVGGDCANGVTSVRRCTVEGCNESESKTEQIAHSWKEMLRVDATCTADEYAKCVCTVCGFSETFTVDHPDYKDFAEKFGELKTRTGHAYGELVVEKEATCGNEGRGYRICANCGGKSEKETIPAKGHAWDAEGFTPDMLDTDTAMYVEASDATCQYEGYNGYYKCFECSYDQHLDAEWLKDNTIGIKDHEDKDANGKCDECSAKLSGDNSCDCICHKDSWIMRFVYKILKFFWKLFKIDKTCACGDIHY